MNADYKRLGFFACVFTGVCLWLIPAAGIAGDPAPGAVLHLANGDFLPGELRGSNDPKVLPWRSPLFARPFDFPLNAVKAVYYPGAAAPAKPSGEFCFELVNGDMFYGDLLGLTADEVTVDSARAGRVQLRRESVRRFYRWQGADPIYLGPNGLAGWRELSAGSRWRDEGGQPNTDQSGAVLFGNIGLPEKAAIEVELSWRRKPDFVLAVGVDERDVSARFAFRLEAWDEQLVAVGESARDADVASVQKLAAGEGHIRVQLYLDQKQRRLVLLSSGGKPLADLKISDANPQTLPGIRLANRQGDVRIEYLRVTRWDGVVPSAARGDESRLHRTDGAIVYDRIATYDPSGKQFVLADGTRVARDAVADAFLAPATAGDKALPEQALRVTYQDGSRFTGSLARLEDAHITLTCSDAKAPVRLTTAEMRSLITLRRGEVPAVTAAGKRGRLELEGLRLQGRLADGEGQPDASCLVWRPDLSLSASPLAKGVSGRIVYRDPPPAVPVPPVDAFTKGFAFAAPGVVVQPQVQVNGAVIVQRFAANANGVVIRQNGVRGQVPLQQSLVPPPSSGQRSLHLRTGDTIPCEVIGMDEKGVRIKSPVTAATFVPHEKIKGVELIAARDTPGIEEAKRDRLLTLPRMQRDSPPTQLICAKNGDFLRGRVVEMNDTTLKVEVRLEVKELPRDRIAQIIWLHADEMGNAKADANAPPPAQPVADAKAAERVQVIQSGGNRLTFIAEKSDHKGVSGTSDVLGACRAELSNVDQLLIGPAIEQSAAQLAYHNWKLHHATDPKFAQGDADAAGDGRSNGLESPLVGKPAFAFQLDSLDGASVRLAERKGRVVVVDFWATWCGPCMQALPQIDAIVREFADRNVDLIAVNLEERPEQIKSVLERHKLQVPVALDRDGKVAGRYGVTAIPQTVVIDREGKIARVFVGGGKATAESLRTFLQELTADKAPAPGGGGSK